MYDRTEHAEQCQKDKKKKNKNECNDNRSEKKDVTIRRRICPFVPTVF
jgi:hypothetical protein